MKVFTVSNGEVSLGGLVEERETSTGAKFPVVYVGENGRGRRLAFLPIQLLAENKKKFDAGEEVEVFNVVVGKTQKGGVKLIETNEENSSEALVVMLTDIGFRGSNEHTGDYSFIMDAYFPFPGEKLCEGEIAQGDAGRMGNGEQFIARIPKNEVFRAKRYGRLYGAPDEYYYVFNGETILAVTLEERESFDLF
ncbi:MAG: hypothetical protein LBU27_06255 [Candidatus Peribacteria bacterium]|jgi:hypothetical protein|nr:hypothetical protein [Candidatus Peribacteria bacterium]